MRARKTAAFLLIVCLTTVLTACKSSQTKEVESMILSLGEISVESDDSLRAARTAYDALSEEERDKVSNYADLVQAEDAYQRICVEALIDEIGPIDENSADKIEAARRAFEELSKAQQELVKNYDALVEAESAYDAFAYEKAKQAIEALSNVEPEETDEAIQNVNARYAALRNEQQIALEKELGDITLYIEEARLSCVKKLIDRINYTAAKEPTADQLEQMIAAVNAYQAMDTAERKKIENFSRLEKALNYYQKYTDNREKTDKLYARSRYIENCVPVSYDQLMAYSGTYKKQTISMAVTISEDGKDKSTNASSADGGQPIILTDKRGIKEPKLTEGEELTVYGVFTGTKTIQVKEEGSGWFGSQWFAKTQEKYDVPVIEILYTSHDNLGVIALGDPNAEDVGPDEDLEALKEELSNLLGELDWKKK